MRKDESTSRTINLAAWRFFSNDGEQLLVFGSHGLEEGQFRRPTGIAIDAQGNAYVVSQMNNNLQVFELPVIEE